MRAAGIVCAFAVACGSSSPAPRRPPPVAPPLEVSVVDGIGVARTVTWTDELKSSRDDEDTGAFAFAQRRTVIWADAEKVGWREPGARIGVSAVRGERAEVVLFAWTGSDTSHRVHVQVAARDLGAAPPADAPPFSAAASAVIGAGQILREPDGGTLGYTFCGPVEMLDEEDGRAHVVQREDGVALEAYLEPNTRWQNDEPCPGLVVVGDPERELVYHDRMRAQRGAMPDGLVEAGPFDGSTFAQLAAKKATIYWLYDVDTGAACEAWNLIPPKRADEEGVLQARIRLADGGTIMTRYGLTYGDEPDTVVTLTGPSSESSSGSMSLGCGSTYHVVARDASGFTMHRYSSTYGPIRAYEPRDTERWYTDKKSCERDAAARNQRLSLASTPHAGC